MKATYGNLDVKGGVEQASDGDILIACPSCGNRYNLRNPPFTFNREAISVGPASIKLFNCGWHGYLSKGVWITSPDSTCGKPTSPAKEEGRKKMAAVVKVGDRIKGLRSHNKAVELTGTVKSVYGTSVTFVPDENENWLETVHIDDVTVLEEAKTEE